MTRINSAIAPKHLTDEHLLAEHREIKRLPGCLDKAIKSGSIKRVPKQFVLGSGHVLFFLDKMKFTRKRYLSLYHECIARGFSVSSYIGNWDNDNIPPDYYQDYEPKEAERDLLVQRISERIMNSSKKSWHYHGKSLSREEAINLLKL